jgi:hypothetical protein
MVRLGALARQPAVGRYLLNSAFRLPRVEPIGNQFVANECSWVEIPLSVSPQGRGEI